MEKDTSSIGTCRKYIFERAEFCGQNKLVSTLRRNFLNQQLGTSEQVVRAILADTILSFHSRQYH